MLTAAGCATRRQRLWDALPGPCDALILSDPQSLIYFANFTVSPFVFRASDAGAVLVLRPGRATLVADKNVSPYVDKAHVDDVVAPVWYDARHTAPHRRTQLMNEALGVLRSARPACIGVEAASVPVGLIDGLGTGLATVALEPAVRRLRREKDADEVALIRQSVAAGEAGFAAALRGLQPGMSELQAYLLVQNAAIEAAGGQVMVYGDFASGPRCETDRGGPPTARKIEAGDLFLLDYSVVVNGYRADFTNTFAVGGGPTDAQRELYRVCMEALAAAESALRPGVPGRDVDRAARAVVDAHGLGHAYPSHTGHGLGLSHPEPPFLVRESEDTVEAGDVVAIEPGVYVPGVGGMRFERNYLVTRDGFECLTGHALTPDQAG